MAAMTPGLERRTAGQKPAPRTRNAYRTRVCQWSSEYGAGIGTSALPVAAPVDPNVSPCLIAGCRPTLALVLSLMVVCSRATVPVTLCLPSDPSSRAVRTRLRRGPFAQAGNTNI